jgi:hypothetical protein
MFLPEERNEQIHDKNGVDITKLDPGTKLEVHTQNSLYRIVVLNPDKRKVEIEGGEHIPEAEEAFLMGSTWGGSMIRLGWIGHTMRMEIHRQQWVGPLITTSVKSLRIIGPNWEYDFDWENGNGKNEET